MQYLPDKTLKSANGRDLPFRFLADWYQYQGDFIRSLDLESYYDTPVYEDQGRLSEVILYDSKKLIAKDARLKLFGNRIEVSGGDFAACWNFDEVGTVTVLGKNKINVYIGDKVYQIKSDERFNALKYVNFFYHYKSIVKGENNGKQFLGL